jgi:hypothetical protein
MSITSISFEDLLKLPFQDPQWKHKGLIGCLVLLSSIIIPILPAIILYGYIAQMVRKVITHGSEDFHLPEWGDLSSLLNDGLKLFGATLIFSLPMLAILLGGQFLMFTFTFLPTMLAEQASQANSVIFGLLSVFGSFAGMALFMLSMLVMMLFSVVIPAGLAHVAVKNDFKAIFHIQEWWHIFQANLGGFLIAFLLYYALSFLVGIVIQFFIFTFFFICLLPLLLLPITLYLSLAYGLIYAQAYQKGVEKLAAQVS